VRPPAGAGSASSLRRGRLLARARSQAGAETRCVGGAARPPVWGAVAGGAARRRGAQPPAWCGAALGAGRGRQRGAGRDLQHPRVVTEIFLIFTFAAKEI
jgi:hypothetical protein